MQGPFRVPAPRVTWWVGPKLPKEMAPKSPGDSADGEKMRDGGQRGREEKCEGEAASQVGVKEGRIPRKTFKRALKWPLKIFQKLDLILIQGALGLE